MSKLQKSVEDMLYDRSKRTGLNEILSKYMLNPTDINTSVLSTMLTTLLSQGGLTSADASGVGYATKTVRLDEDTNAYMSLRVSRKRTAGSIVPVIETSFSETFRRNAPEQDEAYKGVLLTADHLERTLGGDIHKIADSLVAFDNLIGNILYYLQQYETDKEFGQDVFDLYDEIIGDRVVYRYGGLLFIAEIEFNDNGVPTGEYTTSIDCDEIVTNQVFKSDRLGVKKTSVTYND